MFHLKVSLFHTLKANCMNLQNFFLIKNVVHKADTSKPILVFFNPKKTPHMLK